MLKPLEQMKGAELLASAIAQERLETWREMLINKSADSLTLATLNNSDVVLPEGYEFEYLMPTDSARVASLSAFLEKNQEDHPGQTTYMIYPPSYLNRLFSNHKQPAELLIMVVSSSSKLIVGFVAGVLQDYQIASEERTSLVETCLLTVHKKLRNKLLTRVLAKKLMLEMHKLGYNKGIATKDHSHKIPSLEKINPIVTSREYVMLTQFKMDGAQKNKLFKRPEEIDWDQISHLFNTSADTVWLKQMRNPDACQELWGRDPTTSGIAQLFTGARNKQKQPILTIAYHLLYEQNGKNVVRVALIDCIAGLENIKKDPQFASLESIMSEFAEHVGEETGAEVVVGRESLLDDAFWTAAGFVDCGKSIDCYLYNVDVPDCQITTSFVLP